MSFDAAWLDLREPADRDARDPGLRAAALAWLDAAPGGDGAARVIDLGCGTGALWRDFDRPRPGWRLVDGDAGLLRLAAARCPGVETVAADLADLAAVPFDARLVTASALLDLASAAWLDALADRLAAAGAGFYARLSYDGTMRWSPPHPGDAAVLAAFNADQRRDKGLGPALGPDAAAHMAAALARRGFVVRTAASPWRLDSAAAALMAALAEGVARATGASAWGRSRQTARACAVGHLDVLALPGASAQSKTTSESSP